MSATIYLDHNVIVGVSGRPEWQDSQVERQCILQLRASGVRFVLSAWRMYELARCEDRDCVDSYCDFVEELNPLWANNPVIVKRAELRSFLHVSSANNAPITAVVPFSKSVDDMWATYNDIGLVDKTFTSTVRALRSDSQFLKEINEAADLTPDAILTGRKAYRDGRLKGSRTYH